MSQRIWDPYSVLGIIDRNSNSATCVGKTIFDKRCRWDISDANVREIRTILNDREKKRPKYAKKHLRTLARLSLCEGYHQGQASKVIGAWEDSIDDAEANVATDSQTIADLKLKLQKRDKKIVQQSKELELVIENQKALLNKVERLERQRSQLIGQGRDLEQAMKEMRESLARSEILEAQKLTAYEKSDKLEHDLVQAAVKQALLSQRAKTAVQQYTNELEKSMRLHGECDNLKAQLSNAQDSILQARLDLENSHKARHTQETELDTLRATLKAATKKQTSKLHGAQNRTKQVQFDLQTLYEENVELEANLTAAQSTLKQTRLEFESNLQTDRKLQVELVNVKITLDQTVAELVNSRKSNEERDGELSIMKKLLQQTQLESEGNLQAAENQRLELANVQRTLDETVVELVNSRKTNEERSGEISALKKLHEQTELDLETIRKKNEEQDGELSAVKKLLQQTGLDLETSRKVDKNQKADLEDNRKTYEEQKAKLDSTQVLLKSSQVELDNSRKTALEQKETADALVARMQAQIAGLQEQVSRSFMDRVVLRFQKWFATVMREMKVRAGGQSGQGEEGPHMMV